MRHEMLNSACPFLPSRQYKKGHAESAFRDACRTSSVSNVWQNCIEVYGKAGPVVSTVLALPMPPWKWCSKFLEH